MDAWLRRACSASIASALEEVSSVETETSCPAPRRKAAQRSAVWRLPVRVPAPAGVTSAILIR
jgi:hypothetical protein